MNRRIPYIIILIGILITLFVKFGVDLNKRNVTKNINYKDTWRLAVPIKITTLNPQLVSDSIEKGLMSICFNRLVKIDESGALYKLVNENKKDLVVSVALNWMLSDRFIHISNYLYKVCKKVG